MDISISIADSTYRQVFQKLSKDQKIAVINLHEDMNNNYEKDWLIQLVGHPRHTDGYTISDAVAYSQFLNQCALKNIYFVQLLTDKWAQPDKLLFDNKSTLEKLNSQFLKIQWVSNEKQVFDGYGSITNMKLFQLGHNDDACHKISSNFTTYTGHCFIEIGSVTIAKFVANLFSNGCGIRLPYSIPYYIKNDIQPRVAIFLCAKKSQVQKNISKKDNKHKDQQSLLIEKK